MTSSSKRFLYLPSNYKQRTRKTVEGVAKSGEISPKGLVAHTEHWDDTVSAAAAPAAIRYIREPDGRIRPMTFKELVDRGYFIVAKGPSGVRKL